MAGWEDELAVLLRELGVKQEEPQTQQMLRPSRSDVKRREKQEPHIDQYMDASMWDDIEAEEEDGWINDLDLMRQEVDAIVSQVILLMQRGDLEPSLKEDVMVVLRALRRRLPLSQQVASSDEAYLESASALLHFCRLVLQLSELSTEE